MNSRATFASPYYSNDTWYESALRRFSIAHDSIFLTTRHGHTHVLAAGPEAGEPVVLLHGSGGCALAWEPQLRLLSEAGFRAYAPDIPGHHGRSSARPIPYQGSAYAEWLADLLDNLELDRAALVGLSSGAYAALQFTASAANRVTRMALLSPMGLLKARLRRPSAMRLLLTFARETMLEGEPNSVRHLLLRPFRVQGTPPPLAEAVLQACQARALVLTGQHEVFWQPQVLIEQARRFLVNLVSAEIVPQAGHAMILDNAPWVNARLMRFIEHGE